MAWIEVHQSLPTHRKTMALAASLGVSDVMVIGHLVTLWLWALDNAPEGELGSDIRIIARAAHWTKAPELFINAMVDAELLEGAPDGRFVIHDWDAYAGRLVVKRAANKARMQRARAAHVQRTTDARATHVQGLPYRTEQLPPAPQEGAAAPSVELPDSLPRWKELIVQSKDKVAVLVELARKHYAQPSAIPKDAGGRAAALLRRTGDPQYAVALLWEACAKGVEGDPFTYAMGVVKETRNGKFGRKAEGSTSDDSLFPPTHFAQRGE